MKNLFKNYKLKVTTIAPVHVGDGEQYEPTNYVIDDGYLYFFKDSDLILSLSKEQKNELLKIVSKTNSYRQIQLFYKRKDIQNIAKEISLYRVEVSKSIEDNYNQALGRVRQKEGNKEVLNALSINTTIKSNNIPYIPGSSFKGSLKTAFYSFESKNKRFQDVVKEKTKFNRKTKQKVFKDYEFNSNYFGKFEEDPFYKIKVSDLITNRPELQVKWCVNKKKKSFDTDNDNTAVRFEFLKPYSEYFCELTLWDNIQNNELNKINSKIRDQKKQLKQPNRNYSIDEIIKITNDFYIPKFLEEYKWAKERKQLISQEYFNIALKYINNAKNGKGFILRVGQHSGAVSMTLDKHRKIFIPQMKDVNNIKDKYVDSPFTYWLASNVDEVKNSEFIGWIYCELISDKIYNDILQQVLEYQKKFYEKKKEIEKKLYEKITLESNKIKEKVLKEQQKREEEEQRLKKEQEEKKAKLASMTPAQRLIEEYSDIAVLINDMKSGKIENFEEIKIELAQEIKKILQQNPKTWDKAKKKALDRRNYIEGLLK